MEFTTLLFPRLEPVQGLLYLAAVGRLTLVCNGRNVSVTDIQPPESDAPYLPLYDTLFTRSGDARSLQMLELKDALLDSDRALLRNVDSWLQSEQLFTKRDRFAVRWLLPWFSTAVLEVGSRQPYYFKGAMCGIFQFFLCFLFWMSIEGINNRQCRRPCPGLSPDWPFVLLLMLALTEAITLALYWDVPYGWDMITIAVGTAVSTIVSFHMMVRLSRWTRKGLKKAARCWEYWEHLFAKPTETDEKSEQLRSLAYLIVNPRVGKDWTAEFKEQWLFWQSLTRKGLQPRRRALMKSRRIGNENAAPSPVPRRS
jgi:hypothetical protein